jgi:hypothetical protein
MNIENHVSKCHDVVVVFQHQWWLVVWNYGYKISLQHVPIAYYSFLQTSFHHHVKSIQILPYGAHNKIFIQGQCVSIPFGSTPVYFVYEKVVQCVGAFAKQVDMMDLQVQSCTSKQPCLQVSLGAQRKGEASLCATCC